MMTTLEELAELAEERDREDRRRIDELAVLSAHLSAATAHWLELVWQWRERGVSDDLPGFLAYRLGITGREAREYLRVAEALQELPAIRAAFARGGLTFTKVRALTRVATASSEQRLLELAEVLTASQLERALRVYRRIAAAEARETHELEFVDYRFEEDGSLYLRARLAAEDKTVLVKALEAARERIVARRRADRVVAGQEPVQAALPGVMPPRPVAVEALAELAETALAAPPDAHRATRAQVVVHVDAAALSADGRGRSELDDGPVISTETARRLGCDADVVAQLERDELMLSVGRKRRTVPPALRRRLEIREGGTCSFPGCERRRHLQAHHRRHWAHGGETSLDTSFSCASTITASSTRAASRSRTTRKEGCGSETATASSLPVSLPGRRPAASTPYAPSTTGSAWRSTRTPIDTAAPSSSTLVQRCTRPRLPPGWPFEHGSVDGRSAPVGVAVPRSRGRSQAPSKYVFTAVMTCSTSASRIPGKIGRERHSRASASATGKLPSASPRCS
jgi:hypothetical protein